MPQTVFVTLTIAGTNTGPFDLYTDADGYTVAIANNVPKASLQAGYLAIVPDAATIIRVKSDNPTCDNYIDLPITGTPPTTSTTSSTTSTTTTIEYVNLTFYAKLVDVDYYPSLQFAYSDDSELTWNLFGGAFSDTDCLSRGGLTVPKNSNLQVKICTDGNTAVTWQSARTVTTGPIGSCPAFTSPVCIWPIATNLDNRYFYFTVNPEDPGAC